MKEMCMIFNILLIQGEEGSCLKEGMKIFLFCVCEYLRIQDEHHHAYESVCILVDVCAKCKIMFSIADTLLL